MKIRGILQPLAAAILFSVCLPLCSCSDNTAKATPEPTPVVAEVVPDPPAPVVAEAPPAGYKGPVRGLFMDGKILPIEFIPEDMIWDKARIDFNIGEEQWPDAGIRLAWLNRDRYIVPFGMSYKVDKEHPVRPNDKFEVWIRYRIPETRNRKQQKVKGDYTLNLVLDPDSGEGGLRGYVDFESSDPPLVLRGRFEARFKGERTGPNNEIASPLAASAATMNDRFRKRFRQQYPDTKFEILKFIEVRRQKTMNKEMRLGYAEFMLSIEGEKTYRSALMVLTLDGWECVEVLEPWQVAEAFPVIQPQAPPNGNLRYYLRYLTAEQVQATISDQNVFTYSNELEFSPPPLSWCLSKVRYRTSLGKTGQVAHEFLMRKTELGWMMEAELLPGDSLDRATGQITSE